MFGTPCNATLSRVVGDELVPLTSTSLVLNAATSSATSPLVIVISDGNQEEIERFRFIPAKDVLIGSSPGLSFETWCHFQSISKTGRSSLAACSQDEISGILLIQDHFYTIRVVGERVLIVPKEGDTCEFNRRSKRAIRAQNGLPDYYKPYLGWNTRYLELALFADKSMYDHYKDKTSDRLKTIAVHVNSLYSPLKIDVKLIYQEIWTDENKIKLEENGDKTLELFSAYRKLVLSEKPNDNAHLLTRIKFEEGVVGKAYKGTMCALDYSAGVDVDHQDNAALVAATVAHEMGHNFGMGHDPIDEPDVCKCKNEHCLMHPTAGWDYPAYWSDCSLKQLENALNRGVDFCLRNEPGTTVTDENRCGNGVVDPGEQCDCGAEVCPYDCCDGKTCKLREGAECGAGSCCDLATCKRKSRATVCRRAIDVCDLPEYCNGETDECPANFFVQDGAFCPGYADAYCYNGQCGSRDLECEKIWGSASKSGPDLCYEANMHGTYQGNCGTYTYSNYSKCPREDVKCGRLQCLTPAEKPLLGETFSHSYHTVYDPSLRQQFQCRMVESQLRDNNKQPGLVNDGAICAKDKICLSKKCTTLKAIRSTITDCQKNCFHRGVCNNVGNCHCADGYGGTACDIPGYGGSVNSNPATDSRGLSTVILAGGILSLFILIFIGFTIYFHRKKQIWLPSICWEWTKDKLNLRGVLVPIRKAPPPPGGHKQMKRQSKNQLGLGEHHVVTYRTADNSVPIFHNPSPPTLVTGSNRNAFPDQHHVGMGFPAQLAQDDNKLTGPVFSAQSAATVSRSGSLLRPNQPPPIVPGRPRESTINALYEEHANELGIKKEPKEHEYVMPPDGQPPPPIPKNQPKVGSKLERSESLNRPNKAPPPPPAHEKPKLSQKPKLPTKSLVSGRPIVEGDEDDSSQSQVISVKDIKARFEK
ncbi:unnamed protein product, partial [Mesorhabditis belari]|uniref:Uncharacterized protein n=1 Tax=Mesorhabditis belari TaxID=2138241 RepID=A0AAF3EH99_9BILA